MNRLGESSRGVWRRVTVMRDGRPGAAVDSVPVGTVAAWHRQAHLLAYHNGLRGGNRLFSSYATRPPGADSP